MTETGNWLEISLGNEGPTYGMTNEELNDRLIDVMKKVVPPASTATTTAATSTIGNSLVAGVASNAWSNSIYSTGSPYTPSQGWIPQCALCLAQDKYSPAVTLVAGDAVCTDCAKQSLNIIMED